MLTLEEGKKIVERNLIACVVNAGIRWNDKYIFSAFTSDPDEGELDPFYSVDVESGTFSGFSIVGDEDTAGILDAFNAVIEHSDNSESYLAHYGVKGMKWGVRKDPRSNSSSSKTPVSASRKASIAAEKTANIAKVFVNPMIPRANIINRLMEVGNRVSIAGDTWQVAAKASMTSPLAIAGYAVTGLDSGMYRIPGVATKNALRGGWNKDKSLSDPKMSVSDIQKKVVSGINKDYPGLGTTNNCLRCTYTYEMRRRGNDVAATKTMLASGQTSIGPKIMTMSLNSKTKIKNANNPTGIKGLVLGRPPTAKDAFNALSKQPDRSRGDLQFSWGPYLGGHSVAYEIVNGKPVVFDTQSGKTYSTPSQLESLSKRAKGMSFNRLDNKNLNSIGMTAWVKD